MKRLIITTAGTAVLAFGAVAGIQAATPSASASVVHAQRLPSWFHWTYASAASTRAECGNVRGRAIIMWPGDSDTSSMMCPDGWIVEP
jgi:hypothetical protein